ncbi:MAG: L-histidine N(alpha)-methyltransferase [Alphaproteobacteria bacterium]|nr:L-histidine N(alpha)-methyltransferase [Alphaproteobacteria bacterium]|tara:strand:- start:490 stop:1455 length:966 start_codon:yes stop_codon:yes gene_type:complete
MENLNFYNLKEDTVLEDKEIIENLESSSQKKINSKHLYDEIGSKLFEKITNLDDYYPTRSELEILEKKNVFKKNLPESASVIEFGSGSYKKVKKLLEALNNPKEYIPIDISYEFLKTNAKAFAKKFPKINVKAVCADFNQIQSLKKIVQHKSKNLGFFPGSTIGNFVPDEAQKLLKKFAKILGKDNYLVIGVDIRKDKKLMEKAYNDSQGVTAEFNKNILKGINKKTGAKFKTEYFEHFAYFNDDEKRIEMHLISKKNQIVNISNKKIRFDKGETIHTENSYKYSIEEFKKLSISSGYKVIDFVTDKNKYFGVFFLKVIQT